jgi:hypothetical protein
MGQLTILCINQSIKQIRNKKNLQQRVSVDGGSGRSMAEGGREGGVDPAGRKTSTLDLEWKKIEESKQQQGAYQAMSGGRERPPDLPPSPTR